MRVRGWAMAVGGSVVLTVAALGQGPGRAQQPNTGGNRTGGSDSASSATQQATVETAPLDLIGAERYLSVPVSLDAARRVFVMATTDGVLRAMGAEVGAKLREGQTIAEFDRAEANAKSKVAEAAVKEAQAELEEIKARSGASKAAVAAAAARLEAAEGRAELAKIEVDRCTVRAPFAGRLLFAPVAGGQYVTRGQTVAELADVSSVKALVPVDRTAVNPGASLELLIDGKPITGKVQSVVPMAESFATLRELATPWAAAWVVIPNANGAFEPGQRVRSPYLPNLPVTSVPTRALRKADGGGSSLLVVRAERVVEVPVRVMGDAGDMSQVSGPFRQFDFAVIESSVPLVAGTFIRFSGATSGSSNAALADVSAPAGAATGSGGRIAPIGAPDSAVPKAKSGTGRPSTSKTGPASKTPSKSATGGGGTPF